MNAPNTEVAELMTRAVTNVFSTMLSMHLQPSSTPSPPWSSADETLAGTIGFAGSSQGIVCLRTSREFASESASIMLGLPVEELGDSEINDVIGELTNMIAGDLKTYLGPAASAWHLTVPTVIRGQGLHIAAIEGKESCHVECFWQTGTHFVGLIFVLKGCDAISS